MLSGMCTVSMLTPYTGKLVSISLDTLWVLGIIVWNEWKFVDRSEITKEER